jgi:hypothetical protein
LISVLFIITPKETSYPPLPPSLHHHTAEAATAAAATTATNTTTTDTNTTTNTTTTTTIALRFKTRYKQKQNKIQYEISTHFIRLPLSKVETPPLQYYTTHQKTP